MTLIRIFFSTRIWVVLAVIASLAVFFWPTARTFTQGSEELVLLVEVAILVISTGVSIFSTYEVEGKDGYVKDIIGDVLIWTFTIGVLVYVITEGLTGYWLPIAMLGTSSLFAFFDFLFSLNGGASKLLEMDKSQFTKTP